MDFNRTVAPDPRRSMAQHQTAFSIDGRVKYHKPSYGWSVSLASRHSRLLPRLSCFRRISTVSPYGPPELIDHTSPSLASSSCRMNTPLPCATVGYKQYTDGDFLLQGQNLCILFFKHNVLGGPDRELMMSTRTTLANRAGCCISRLCRWDFSVRCIWICLSRGHLISWNSIVSSPARMDELNIQMPFAAFRQLSSD